MDLQTIFMLSFNHKNYYDQFEKHPFPKIPVVGLWLGDMIRLSDMKSYTEKNTLNMIKIEKISNIMNRLLNAREMRFTFLEITAIQEFLNNYNQGK